MRAESHEGSGLKYLTVLPDDYDSERSYPLVVMLHGFGANMQDLAGSGPGHKLERVRICLSQCAHSFRPGLGAGQLRLDVPQR